MHTIKNLAVVFSLCVIGISASMAEEVGGKNGYLQPLSNTQIEDQIHQHLIEQIRIENPQPYTEDDVHWHHGVWRCTKGTQHSHRGKRRHTHKYKCVGKNKTVDVIALSTRPKPTSRTESSTVQSAPVARRMAKMAPKPQASSTNLQEAGVDEADFVKTDGRYIYAISNHNYRKVPSGIRIFDTATGTKQPKQLGAIGFEKGLSLTGMYLVPRENKLIVMGTQYHRSLRKRHAGRWSSQSSLITIDIRNKAKPRVLQHVKFEGYSRSTRRIGDKLYMVIANHGLSYPSTYTYVETPKKMTEKQYAGVRNGIVKTIKQWKISDAMPHYRVMGKSPLKVLNKNNSRIMTAPGDAHQYALTTLLTVDLAAKAFDFNAVHYLGYVGTLYASTKALYITQDTYRSHFKSLNKKRFPKRFDRQLIHKFAYKNKGVDYRGSGLVFGSFGWSRNSTFQLDEDDKGVLRVVSQNWRSNSKKFTDPATKSPVILTALKEHPHQKQLMTLSRLPNHKRPKALGKKGERLYASRLFNDYAYFVTFRRTDPLYVVDLRNPRDMIVRGELKIPDFSDYLHPISNTLLMGIGKEADNDGRVEGMKLSLFDISNPNLPREVDKMQLGKRGTHSPANHNHHAFTSLKMRQSPITRVSLPIHLVKKESDNYRGKQGLHQFEINAKTQKLTHVGKLAPPNTNKRSWHWNSTDRSIIIGNKVYYYQHGKIWAGSWGR